MRKPGFWTRPDQVLGLACVLVFLQAMLLGFVIAGTHGWLGGKVGPNTTDYASFYAAGRLADAGRPQDAYDHAAHLRAEEAATAPGIKYQYFFNPPTYLLLNQPLALLPYIPRFVLFQALTLAFWLRVGTRAAGGGAAATAMLLAVPSVWWVLGLGQNAFLNAALLGGGMLALERRPVLAGIAFGALCYKPHLGLMLPVALLAGRYWRTIAAAGATVALLTLLSVALYGVVTWAAFLDMVRGSGGAIGGGDVLFAAHLDPAGALRFAGLPWPSARALAVPAGLLAAGCVGLLWWRGAAAEARYAALAAGTLLVVPFVLFYDLIIASLAAAWLVQAGRRGGFLPGERAVLVACFALNLLAALPVVLRAGHGVAFGALVAPLLLGLAVRRGLRPSGGAGAPGPRGPEARA